MEDLARTLQDSYLNHRSCKNYKILTRIMENLARIRIMEDLDYKLLRSCKNTTRFLPESWKSCKNNSRFLPESLKILPKYYKIITWII